MSRLLHKHTLRHLCMHFFAFVLLCYAGSTNAHDGRLGATSMGSVNITVNIAPKTDAQALWLAIMAPERSPFFLKKEKIDGATLVMICSN